MYQITMATRIIRIEPYISAAKAEGLRVTHVNLNDGTVEGFAVADKPVWSVQYHPEAAPGPHDASQLFDRFLDATARK